MTLPDLDTQLNAEREHLAASRAALARMRARTEALYATGGQVAGDAYSAETLGTTLRRRVAQLADDPNTPLFFGRLDFADDHRLTGPAQVPAHDDHRLTGPAHEADYHIGRRH